MTHDDAFPIERTLCFDGLAAFWQRLAETPGAPQRETAQRVVAQWKEATELHGLIADPGVLVSHQDTVDKLLAAIFPSALLDDAYLAVLPPFGGDLVVAQTSAMASLGVMSPEEAQIQIDANDAGRLERTKLLYAYTHLLREHFGVNLPFEEPLVLRVYDPRREQERFFQLRMDSRFVDVETREGFPEVSAEDVRRLADSAGDLTRWIQALPPHTFAFSGFSILHATDVTDREVLSALKNELLRQGAMTAPERIDRLRDLLRIHLGIPDLETGFVCLNFGEQHDLTQAHAIGRSLLMPDGTAPACEMASASTYARVVREHQSLALPDLSTVEQPTRFETALLERGHRSLALLPLVVDGTLVGLLELASPRPNTLTALRLLRMHEATDLFAHAMKRALEYMEEQVQSVIKRHYTALHPTVEWRFRSAALAYLTALESDPRARLDPITFDQVYPLYSQSDIRGSSTLRNESIQADLDEQLQLAEAVVGAGRSVGSFPALDELAHRLAEMRRTIANHLSTGDESNVLTFLHREVEPLLDRLADRAPAAREAARAYRTALDPKLGALYQARRAYEVSVTRVNEAVACLLDERENQAQAIFPFYSERFQTDGVEHSLYIGEALAERGGYDPLYLRNLRLWQLTTLAEIAQMLFRLGPTLPVPLEATHLILVQHQPLAIRFREEEKQFDVDGTYNVRYEIIKKRVDKAHIAHTGERLTQPGQIAIVYSRDEEAHEYRRYLGYLATCGLVEPTVEEVRLEDLQGVSGLRALRVQVARSPDALPSGGDGLLLPLPEPMPLSDT